MMIVVRSWWSPLARPVTFDKDDHGDDGADDDDDHDIDDHYDYDHDKDHDMMVMSQWSRSWWSPLARPVTLNKDDHDDHNDDVGNSMVNDNQ